MLCMHTRTCAGTQAELVAAALGPADMDNEAVLKGIKARLAA